jgi:glycosyltransferase involved in cell wall biosynthesis
MNLLLFNLRVDRDDTALGFTTDWINELAKHFETITVITMFAGIISVAPNVRVLSAGREKGYSKPWRAVLFYRQLFHTLRTQRIDVCFAHMMPLFAAMAAPILKLRGIPMALWYAHNHPSRMLRVADVLVDRAFTSVASAYPIPSTKLRVLGQGIDTARFSPLAATVPRPELVFYTVGRISAVKRLEAIVEAFALFHAERAGLATQLLIVGDCLAEADLSYRARLDDMVHAADLDELVRFVPSVPFHQVHRVHQEGDVFLHANDNGLDKALLEAMSCAVPAIACHPAVSGALGEWAAQAPLAIAQRMIMLADMPADQRRALGDRLRTFIVDHHGLTALGARLAQELGELR